MVQLHIIHAESDVEQVLAVQGIVEASGYSVWRDLHGWTPGTYNHERALDTAILGCDLVVLLWSVAASQSLSAYRQLQLADQLLKPIIAIRQDSCPLPPQVEKSASFALAASHRLLLDYLGNCKPDLVLQTIVRQLADERVGTRRHGI